MHILFCLVFILFGVSSAFAEDGEKVIDRVLVEVNGEPITESQVKAYVASKKMEQDDDAKEIVVDDQAALNQLISERLIREEAQSAGITVSSTDVEAYIAEIQRQNGVDKETLKTLLKEQGLSYEGYLQQVEGDIMKARILASQVRNKINIVDEDIERYLSEHKERIPTVGRVLLEQLFFPVDGANSQEQACSQAQAHHKKILSGAKFNEQLADKYKNLGYVNVDELRPEFSEVVKKLDIEQVSEVVRVDTGCYIFRALFRQGDDGIVDQRLKDDIRRELFEIQYKESADRFLSQELPKKYHLEYKTVSK